MGREKTLPPSDEQKFGLVDRIIRGELTPAQARDQHGLSSAELKEWVRVYRREARRALDERVRLALSTQGMDVNDLAAAEFSGDVDEMGVGELLQTVQFGRKDAEIRIEHGTEQSRIWCTEGDVVDAESARLRGEPAVYRLLSLERGRVHADFAAVSRARTITVSTQALLMEGARRHDECRELRKQLGDMDATYVPSARSLSPDVKASAAQFGVLRLFDGIRSMDDVVRESSAPDLETLTYISQLLSMKLLEPARESRTSLLNLPVTVEMDAPEVSCLPFAASLGAQPEQAPPPRTWLWVAAAIGSATLGAAVAVRIADPQSRGAATSTAPALMSVPAPVVLAAAPAPPPPPSVTCPEGTAGAVLSERVCMDRHEVTVQEHAACVAAGECDAPLVRAELPHGALTPELRKRAQKVFGRQCNAGHPDRDAHPINCISLTEAERYCAWQGGRLPSEAEWELFASGKEGRSFPWGNASPAASLLNACGAECKASFAAHGLHGVFEGVMYDGDDGYTGTAPVGSFPAGSSPDGVLDLFGNVAEWTSSRVEFDEVDGEDGDKATASHVVRGGSFSSGVEDLGAPALRLYLSAETQSRSVGFRCVFEPSAAPAVR